MPKSLTYDETPVGAAVAAVTYSVLCDLAEDIDTQAGVTLGQSRIDPSLSLQIRSISEYDVPCSR